MAVRRDKRVDLLQLIRKGNDQSEGLRIIKVNTTVPHDITFVFEGTPLALDIDIFEIPIDFYPLRKGERLLVYPIVSSSAAKRWGALQKIDGGVAMATMQGPDSLRIDGISKVYDSSEVIAPRYVSVGASASRFTDSNGKESDRYLTAGDIRSLTAGDRVSIVPTLDNGKLKYVVLEKY